MEENKKQENQSVTKEYIENPPAFPLEYTIYEKDDSYNVFDEGMRLRDYFAAKNMQSIYSAYYSNKDACDAFRGISDRKGITVDEVMCKAAYEAADAMLKERSK